MQKPGAERQNPVTVGRRISWMPETTHFKPETHHPARKFKWRAATGSQPESRGCHSGQAAAWQQATTQKSALEAASKRGSRQGFARRIYSTDDKSKGMPPLVSCKSERFRERSF